MAGLSSSLPNGVPKLPADIAAWNYEGNSSKYGDPVRRLWDRSFLHQAMAAVNYEQLHGFVAKLHAGQPVTVVAFGDSITADHGGCFHRSAEQLAQRIEVPHRLNQIDRCPLTPRLGWLTSFMQMINATWPHPDHLLRNLGVPGTSFALTSRSDCVESHIPKQVDLVIMEHLPYLEEKDSTIMDAERLLHRLWLHLEDPLPAVIFFNMQHALDDNSPEERCIMNGRKCKDECPTSFDSLPKIDPHASRAEVQTHAVAHHHNMASFSYVSFLLAMTREKVYAKTGLTACEFFAAMYRDRVHPGDTGRLLLADVLVNYVAGAEEYFLAHPAPPIRQKVIQPLSLDSLQVKQMRCYLAMPAAGGAGSGSGNPAAAPLQNLTALAAGGAGAHETNFKMRQVLPIKVASSSGWSLVERDGEAQKYKPGWVATAVGAVMQVELDTGFKGTAVAAGVARPVPIEVMLTTLRSYQHMGKANVSCADGCHCSPPWQTVDAHEPVHRHSVPVMLKLDVIAAPASGKCLLRFEVLPATSSGEHKFKVIDIALGTVKNMTLELRAVAQRQQRIQVPTGTTSLGFRPLSLLSSLSPHAFWLWICFGVLLVVPIGLGAKRAMQV